MPARVSVWLDFSKDTCGFSLSILMNKQICHCGHVCIFMENRNRYEEKVLLNMKRISGYWAKTLDRILIKPVCAPSSKTYRLATENSTAFQRLCFSLNKGKSIKIPSHPFLFLEYLLGFISPCSLYIVTHFYKEKVHGLNISEFLNILKIYFYIFHLSNMI